jgi:hypothetical protein
MGKKHAMLLAAEHLKRGCRQQYSCNTCSATGIKCLLWQRQGVMDLRLVDLLLVVGIGHGLAAC